MPPVTAKPVIYDAFYIFSWLSASGTACLASAILSPIVLRVFPAIYEDPSSGGVMGKMISLQSSGGGGRDFGGQRHNVTTSHWSW
jgi:hypothetical protein